jgi:parallel beta-helix repeat protein
VIGNASDGILIDGGILNVVGNGTLAGRNIVVGNGADGIEYWASNNGTVLGNYVGVDVTGTREGFGNLGSGIVMNFYSSSAVIGSDTDLSRNIIGSNAGYGIGLGGSANCTIEGNYIGTEVTGTVARPNGNHGICGWSGVSYNRIVRNVASGNVGAGIRLDGCPSNEVLGNMIGVNVAGDAVMGNGSHGVAITSSSDNVIGDGTVAGRNIIAGNNYGILSNGASYLTILGNYIGLDVTGTREGFGNINDGLNLIYGSNIVVGKDTALERNIVSSNTGIGIALGADTNSTVEGNYVGTDVTGKIARPNLGRFV